MGKHLQKTGFTPDYTVWTFHGESARRDRAEVDRRRTDEHGTEMENMVQDFDDARDSDEEMEESAKAFNEMLESSKRPLHEHTELCQLDAISQVMALKAQFNLGIFTARRILSDWYRFAGITWPLGRKRPNTVIIAS